MDWGQAFAKQACSDFAAREQLLLNAKLPHCHQLHYLQMAMEKAAKAHLIARGDDPLSVQKSHAYTKKVIPIIVRDRLQRTPGGSPPWLIDAIRSFAERVELLHPQITASDTVLANCEYPWADGAGKIIAPADFNFGINLYRDRAAVTMIKEVRARVMELASETTA